MRIYPYEYICYRITNYRPESYPDLRLSGQEASHDLRLFVEDVSDAAGVQAEAAGENVMTVEELAKRFSVSTKTISRWRRQGLVSRRFVMDGRKRVGFLQSSVDRFVERNQERVQRGAQFSQLTDEERVAIVEHTPGGLPAPARFPRTSPNACREKPAAAPKPSATPSSSSTATIPRPPSFQKTAARCNPTRNAASISSTSMANRSRLSPSGFCRTRTSIYRIIGEMRAQRIMDLPLEHIPNDLFARVRSHKREDRIIGAIRVRSCRRKSRGCPAICLPIWPASMRCRC